MSGKRYENVSDSSSEEEYDRRYNKNSYENYRKYDDYEDDCDKTSKKAETSSSSFDIRIKRGRGHSKRPCMNKNAQAARENRIRKKKHLEQVENKLSFYQEKNKSLVNVIQKQDIDIKKLKGEVTYLRCILKNNTNITALLQSMNEGLSKRSKNKLTKNKLYNGNKTSSMDRITNAKKNINSANRQRVLQTIPKGQISPNNSESDHTYTIPKIQHGINDEDIENCKNVTVFNEQIFLDFDKETSVETSPSTNSDQIINGNISDTEMEEWSRLNVDIYDNFKNFDEALSPSDYLENLTNLYDDTNVIEQFRDAGICLHVNSEKVSLEFCSICHMNSLNSMPE